MTIRQILRTCRPLLEAVFPTAWSRYYTWLDRIDDLSSEGTAASFDGVAHPALTQITSNGGKIWRHECRKCGLKFDQKPDMCPDGCVHYRYDGPARVAAVL